MLLAAPQAQNMDSFPQRGRLHLVETVHEQRERKPEGGSDKTRW
jgi:hypothetical protein